MVVPSPVLGAECVRVENLNVNSVASNTFVDVPVNLVQTQNLVHCLGDNSGFDIRNHVVWLHGSSEYEFESDVSLDFYGGSDSGNEFTLVRDRPVLSVASRGRVAPVLDNDVAEARVPVDLLRYVEAENANMIIPKVEGNLIEIVKIEASGASQHWKDEAEPKSTEVEFGVWEDMEEVAYAIDPKNYLVATSQAANRTTTSSSSTPTLSSSLKFVLSNIKNIVQSPLSPDNYHLWRSQILKICRANGLLPFLDNSLSIPEETITSAEGITTQNPVFDQWILTDQNLSAAICATISSSILPYVLHLDHTADIWHLLETRFQAANRSRMIQLKNELYNISLKNSTMVQYLNEVKILVDNIAAAGSKIDPEEIILHILNGLPPAYQSFKTSIRTMVNPLGLDQFYSLLISEEIHNAADHARLVSSTDQNQALFVSRGRGRRPKSRPPTNSSYQSEKPSTGSLQCQICSKKGHSAMDCWHRTNLQYTSRSDKPSNKALLSNTNQSHTDWYLDSGASSHLTRSLDNLSMASPYQGTDGIVIGDGSSVSIENSGRGLLPTPSHSSRNSSGTMP
ncbi:hypothetical protein KFK09_010731 [Dendrobium nobile]|uniref:Retrovirus-related Pol polyprotein from transposon TNT 1-94 n=1 Tax=Dendrobium nobile TaxID=94219 RepID=A0A8T3BDL4_DENNO|nr:hypothetical protein KFK09_010731 [Dendrobium nobile]